MCVWFLIIFPKILKTSLLKLRKFFGAKTELPLWVREIDDDIRDQYANGGDTGSAD